MVKQQSVSVVGARMMGKTSLLKYLASAHCRDWYRDEHGHLLDIRLVHIDMQEHRHRQCDEFMPLLARAMSELVPEREHFTGHGHYEALAWIKAMAGHPHQNRPRWVLLFDEFDRVVDIYGLEAALFDELRSLVQHYHLSFVVASRRKLIDLPLPQHITTSPFFNLFKEVFLTVWDESTTRKLMFKPRGQPFNVLTADDVHLMSQLTARHPLLLQIGCYHLVNQRRTSSAETNGLEQLYYNYMQEAENVYRYYWQYEINDTERAWLLDCWHAITTDNPLRLATFQRNTPQRKNHTIRMKLAKLGLVLGQRGQIILPEGVRLFLGNGEQV
jgi:hypothetical protein